jgi:hypothetical protein
MVVVLLIAAALLLIVGASTALGKHDSVHLARLSRLMSTVTLAAAVLVPLASLFAYVAPGTAAPLNLQLGHLGHALTDAVPLEERLFAFGCAAIPLAVLVWGLLRLRRLFRLFASGTVFSSATSTVLSSFSLALFLFVITSIVAEAPISYFLTRAMQPDAMVTLSLGAGDLVMLFAACVLGVIARVMSEAAKVADENASFV